MEKPKNSLELYSEKILELAANISLHERLNSPDISIEKRAPICGSMVTVDLNISKDKIVGYAHDVKACALGQASASILSKDIIGKTLTEIITARVSVKKMLAGDRYLLDIFKDYSFLSPAVDYKHRHASIMLVLDATVEGIEKIKNSL